MNLFALSFLILISSVAFADTPKNIKLLVEKTYPRDNTFCRFKNKLIEIEIRGDSRETEKRDAGYGQYVFQKDDAQFSLLPINKDKFGRYRFYKGKSQTCSKSLAVELDSKTIAILFLKDNRPFKEKLVVQLYDIQMAIPKEVIETDYLSDQLEIISGGFQFRSASDRVDRKFGKVKIADHEYIFQDEDMSPIVKYSAKGFEILPDETFEKSPWRSFFKDKNDFFMFTGWKPEEKKFINFFVYTAVNHDLKRACVLFSSTSQSTLTGSEFWRCKDN